MTCQPMIEMEDLSKVFSVGDGQLRALDHVSLTIGAGEIFGIIGMSGAGKSTLVRCINYLERPTEGTVRIDGQDLSAMTKGELAGTRKHISMVFQHFNLLMQRNVLQNVLFPLELVHTPRAQARKKARELLELVGLAEKADAYPAQLSGGQKQRVAIARALATDPKVLLCDEATSALDPMTTRSILALLKEINVRMGLTVVIITHEMAVIKEICTHVAVLENGRLAETGPVAEICAHPGSQAARNLFFAGQTAEVSLGQSGRLCRVYFDGQPAAEPYLSRAVLETGVLLRILRSDLRYEGDRVFGEAALALPEEGAARVVAYLRQAGLTVEEVENDA